ncbi:hypothetical protein IWX50DRAFT_641054 [Phyllosticta citricarpa]
MGWPPRLASLAQRLLSANASYSECAVRQQSHSTIALEPLPLRQAHLTSSSIILVKGCPLEGLFEGRGDFSSHTPIRQGCV